MNAKATATVKIISIWSKDDSFEGIVSGRNENIEYDVEVERGETDEDTLSNAFKETNWGERCYPATTSTTAGDIMVLDGVHYFVDRVGFVKLTEEQSKNIQEFTSRDTCMGFNWLKKHKML